MTFAEKEKRIAYAPSFGVNEIPKEFENNYKDWLLNIPSISVREKAGAKIIEKLTGRKAEVVVDPTLLLTKDEWLAIATPAKNKTKNKFLLTYFLGDLTLESEYEIKKIAANENLEIINLANFNNPEVYTADPSEFLDYINTASIFFTDSFHGVVFSILLDTPFVVYERKGKSPSMNSRIDNLLSLFKLEDRKNENLKGATISKLIDVDYSHVNSILEIERTNANRFIENALGIKRVK